MSAAISQNILLHTRKSSEWMISISWNAEEEQIAVHCQSQSEDFIMYPPNCKALDCFYHPFAYRDRVLTRGTYFAPDDQPEISE